MKKFKYSGLILILICMTISLSGCNINTFRKRPTNQMGLWVSETPNMYFESAKDGNLGIGELITEDGTIPIAIGFGPGPRVYIGYLDNETPGVGEIIFKSNKWTMKGDKFIMNLEGEWVENHLDPNLKEIIFIKSQSKPISYDIVKHCFEDGKIKINYPQIIDFINEDSEKIINELLEQTSKYGIEYYELEESEKNDLDLEINYVVKCKTDKMLSVVFQGLGEKKGTFYPNHLFYTINVDLKNLKVMKLSDYYIINEDFLNVLFENNIHSDDIERECIDYLKRSNSNSKLLEEINYSDNGFNYPYYGVFSYFTEETVGISLSVLHALGDHVELEINKTDIQKFLKS